VEQRKGEMCSRLCDNAPRVASAALVLQDDVEIESYCSAALGGHAWWRVAESRRFGTQLVLLSFGVCRIALGTNNT
jgi:hypothetical protein